MFTGIVEEVGTVRRIRRGVHSASIDIQARHVVEDVHVGDSIAVMGVCLTVTDFTSSGFTADVMHETLERSSLGGLSAGSRVNLERAMRMGGRFGGHIVSGHIDGTGIVSKVSRDDTAIWYSVRTDSEILRHIVRKGSIAIDGISLTVAGVDDAAGAFSVSTIPHTNAVTTLSDRRVGDMVNLECDVIGKYVERLIGLDAGLVSAGEGGKAGGASLRGQGGGSPGGITMELLRANGF